MNNALRFVFTLLLLTTISLAQAQELALNGLTVHRELRKELFISALYVPTPTSNAVSILQSQERQRMEMRVLSDRITPRRFTRLWIDSLAINNSGQALEQNAEYMVTFNNLFEGALVRGDRVVIERIPDQGTRIAINGQELAMVPSPDFFSLMLRSWLGPVPPSTDYRENLLSPNAIDEQLLAQYQSLEPDPQRQDIYAAWTGVRTRVTVEQETQTQPDTSALDAPQIAAPTLDEAAVTGGAEAAEGTAAADETAASTTPAAAAQTPQQAPQQEAATAQQQPAPQQAPAQAQPAQRPEQPRPAEAVAEDEAVEALTAEALLGRQLYQAKLLRWTYKYLSYPDRAMRRNLEGSVRLAVTINRDGEVQDITVVEESEHGVFTREAETAVERASPYPGMPDNVPGESFQFTVPIVFRLN